MKPELKFETIAMQCGSLGQPSSVPDLGGNLILQNNLTFKLEQDDFIFQGYGKLPSAYPYRQQSTYSRKLQQTDVKTAVLENDFIKAVFLPEFGGRLWSLVDKKTGVNLLYTNDVIRFSNLSSRNAWFSGGVEWNIGIIGHSPLTNEPLFTAELKNEQGNPVLRMYSYERIREVEYQMDFWLGENDTMLNCRMRIVNHSEHTLPMYWWSNMAVPEYQGGRVIAPAQQAYTCVNWTISKTKIPYVGDADISLYETIPDQVDYFFDIPKESPKYIANINKDGYGLLQVSTSRLRSRKLFSWGHNKGSARWQAFLTENAGRYVEIQAGLGKTQYGCIPMEPDTTWEWLEQYGSIQLSVEKNEFELLKQQATAYVDTQIVPSKLETLLQASKNMAVTPATVVYKGTEHGALKCLECDISGNQGLSAHLDYGNCTQEYSLVWAEFLKTGRLPQRAIQDIPEDFQCSSVFYEALKQAVCQSEQKNWYAHYQLGLMHWFYQDFTASKAELLLSQELQPNPWSCHGLAILHLETPNIAQKYINLGLQMRNFDLSYVKEAFKLLSIVKGFEDIINAYQKLPQEICADSRIKFEYMKALAMVGRFQEGYDLLMADKEYLLTDIREGEDSIAGLYQTLYQGVFGAEPDCIPQCWNFNSF